MSLRFLRKALAILATAAAACMAAAPESIILFIGDGMGASHVTAAKYAKGTLEMERFRIAGYMATHAANAMVTDSAAGGTALATGRKTANGMIAQAPDGAPLKTALEVAQERGKSTGLVATSAITHATPAAFAAHVPSRRMEPEIAGQIVARGIDVLLGGGLGFFIPQSEPGSKRMDDLDLLQMLQDRMAVATSADQLRAMQSPPPRLAGLLAHGALPKASEGRIPLAELVARALEVLAQNERGFFLVVEGSQIDWGGHANDAGYIISEMIDFDEAVGAGLDFAERDGKTLVVATSDHETGGFAVLGGSVEGREVAETGFATTRHSAQMVPVFAYGPGAEAFGGILDNTDVGARIIGHLEARAR